jgi:hypothetical protein
MVNNYKNLLIYKAIRGGYRYFVQKKRSYIYSLYLKQIFNFYKTNFIKNALIIYQPASFLLPLSHSWYKKDSLYERNRIIARVLMENKYNVDVISVFDKEFSPSIEYDLIFSNGSEYKRIYKSQLKKPKIILHYTTAYYAFHNEQQEKRLYQYRVRTGLNFDIQRPEDLSNNGEFADRILSMGNEFTKSTFPKEINNKIIMIPNFPIAHLNKIKKHVITEDTKKNFLYMASKGSILKGLDLLMEVFSRPEMDKYNLYVSGSFENEPEFMDYYENYFNLDNIHKIGWLHLNKKKSTDLIKMSSFHIFPSCSEGMPGAVITTMSLGLIPIVTKESGIAFDNNEFIITEDINHIAKIIEDCANLDLNELRSRSNNIIKHTLTLKNQFEKVVNSTIKEIDS